MNRGEVRIFVAVGSSLDPSANVVEGLRRLGQAVEIRAVSTFYRTPADLRPGDPPFLNGVVEIRTPLEPMTLKASVLRRVEAECGRRRGPDPCAPRTLDLDLLLYGERVVCEPGLELPDPAVVHRAYVAVPLLELAGDRPVPGAGKGLAAVVRDLDTGGLEPLEGFTRRLRRTLGLGA